MLRALVISISFMSTIANADCLNISGTYASPFNTNEMKTTFAVSQLGCDSISVTSITVANGVSSSTANFKLDGSVANGCIIDTFASCGSLKAIENRIEKTDPKFTYVGDLTHGFCNFKSTFLTKDASGNLVEKIENAECEDGFKGEIQPLIYLKMNKM